MKTGRRRSVSTALLLIVLTLSCNTAFAREMVIDLPHNMDTTRTRNIPAVFHLPEQQTPQPLVLVSHGGAGSRHGMYALAAEIAENGYVVMCLEHITSNTDDIRHRMRTRKIGFKDALLDCAADPVPRKNRPLDVRFAIDLAERLNRDDLRFKGRIDLSRIAILGHSYGAYTAMVCCGAKPVGIEGNCSENRIKLGIALSPQSSNGNFFNTDSFSEVNGPFVGISGMQDIQGDGHRDFFRLMPKGDKHLLWFYDANHFSFSDPSGGPRSLPNPDTDVTRALKIIVPEILDVYLREKPVPDQTARADIVAGCLGGKVRNIEWQVR